MSAAPSWIRLAAGSIFFWVGGLFCLIALPLLVFAGNEALSESMFIRKSQPAQATVLEKSLQNAEPGKNSTTRYLLHYRFVAPDGTRVEQTETVSVEEWESAAPGGIFEIRFLPGQPARSRAANETDWPVATAFMALGVIFAGVGGLLVFIGGKETMRQWRLWRTGIPVPATVTSITSSSVTINGVRQLQICYRYKDSLGVTHDGSSSPMSPDRAAEWSKGDRGFARFDQQNTDSSIWTGKE